MRSDPVSTVQWVVAIGFLLRAEDAADRGSAIDRPTALIIADTALEAGLSIIAAKSSKPYRSDRFPDLLKAATVAGPIRHGLSAEIDDIHKLRNTAVHQGGDVGSTDVIRALEAGRELLDVNVPRALRQRGHLGRGAGVADAVAVLIDPHPVAEQLRLGSRLVSRDPKAALEAVADALDQAESNVRPVLPRTRRSLVFPRPSGAPGSLDRHVREIDEAVRGIARWVAPMALGLSPAEYDRLSEPLPHVFRSLGGNTSFHWAEDAQLDASTARRTLEGLALVVLRLWLSDLLRYPEPEYRAASEPDPLP